MLAIICLNDCVHIIGAKPPILLVGMAEYIFRQGAQLEDFGDLSMDAVGVCGELRGRGAVVDFL